MASSGANAVTLTAVSGDPDGTLAGYTRLRELRAGAAGSVYRARSSTSNVVVGPGREVVVTVLPPLDGDDEREWFERDCRAVAGLTGRPHVLPLLDSGFTGDGLPSCTPTRHAWSNGVTRTVIRPWA